MNKEKNSKIDNAKESGVIVIIKLFIYLFILWPICLVLSILLTPVIIYDKYMVTGWYEKVLNVFLDRRS